MADRKAPTMLMKGACLSNFFRRDHGGFSILAFAVIFVSCTSYHAFCQVILERVVRPAKALALFGKGKITVQDDSTSSIMTFDDRLLGVRWIMADYHLNMSVRNKSGAPILIRREESAYIDEQGKSCRVIHGVAEHTTREAA